jgi:hypothetical protein
MNCKWAWENFRHSIDRLAQTGAVSKGKMSKEMLG